MRVALVTGPVPVGSCGVADYTRLLATVMSGKGVDVAMFEVSGPAMVCGVRLRAATKKFKPDVTHLQYPTPGFGKRITPQLFSLFMRFVLTSHEVEGRHLLRRLSLYPLWARALHVVFTCKSNRDYSLRWAPWLRGISSVIPLSSNIPVASIQRARTGPEVIHFGLIRPNKGIEDVLAFARLTSAAGLPLKLRIVGSTPPEHMGYLRKVQSDSRDIPITWDLNLSTERVAQRLAEATIAYMPFPEGATERHTSILAALANGLPVLTTSSRLTPSSLSNVVRFCATPREAVAATKELLADPDLREVLGANARRYASRFSWENIAESHIQLYQRLIAENITRREYSPVRTRAN